MQKFSGVSRIDRIRKIEMLLTHSEDNVGTKMLWLEFL